MKIGQVIRAAAVTVFLTTSQFSLAARHIQITSCPYTANVAGAIYTIAQKMDGHGTCIDVTAPNITLKMNGQGVSGGIGVSIETSAKNAHILGPGVVWGGIVDQGDSAVIKGLTLQGDIGYGLLIWGATGTLVENNEIYGAMGVDLRASQKCKIDHNKVRATSGGEYDPAYDVWIESAAEKGQSRGNIISNNNLAGKNGLDGASMGILVGDSVEASGNCPAGTFPIEDTVITNNNASNHSGWGVPGIGISLGCENDTAHSIVKNNVARGNGALYAPAFDLYDGNTNCGTNVWSGNHFKTSNQSCIK